MKTLLELEETQHIDFERRSWRMERAGWLLIALLLAATLAGALGPGLLSSAHARTPGGELELAYPRFLRVRADGRLEIRIREAGAREARLWIAGPWLERVRVLSITPPPTRSELTDGRWTLVFATSKSALRELAIALDVEPQSAGSLAGSVGLDSGAKLDFRTWVYP
jgi:hypothetical protein